MSTPTDIPSINFFGQTWGPPLTATFIASVIYGITVLQTFYYYNRYPRDRRAWKLLVAAVFVLDTAAMALWMYVVYYYLVLSWGIPAKTAIDVQEFPSEYILTSILVFLVQGFYINAIKALKAPPATVILLVLLSLTALASGLILPVVQINLQYIQIIIHDELNHTAFNIARSTALACDIGIVITFCWILRLRKIGIASTNNMINFFMVISLQRGVLQAIVQAGEMLAYAIRPNGVLFLPFHVIASRIYCTSFLATLNSREYIVQKGLPEHRRRGQLPQFRSIHIGSSDSSAQNDTHNNDFAAVEDSGPVFSSYVDPPFLFGTLAPGVECDVEAGDGEDHLNAMQFAEGAGKSELDSGGTVRLSDLQARAS